MTKTQAIRGPPCIRDRTKGGSVTAVGLPRRYSSIFPRICFAGPGHDDDKWPQRMQHLDRASVARPRILDLQVALLKRPCSSHAHESPTSQMVRDFTFFARPLEIPGLTIFRPGYGILLVEDGRGLRNTLQRHWRFGREIRQALVSGSTRPVGFRAHGRARGKLCRFRSSYLGL